MSAFEKLKQRSLVARKNRDKIISTAAITLIGELETDAKRSGAEITDEQVYARAKKLIASNYETIEVSKDLDKIGILNQELEFYDSLLPKQLDEAELTSLIQALNPNHIGEVMKHLKENYAGRYDGKMASAIAKNILG